MNPSNGKHLVPTTIAALGIVYGDIGTSPLYAFRACFVGSDNLHVNAVNIMGVLSLIFWSLVLVVSLKYLVFVMQADRDGEGGILALMSLVDPDTQPSGKAVQASPASSLSIVTLLGLFGAALLYGDGVITIGLLGVGVIASLAKGFGYEESIILSLLLVALLPCRSHFNRRGNLLAPTMTLGWFAPFLMAVGLLVWIVLFAYRHVDYSSELWWQFTYHGDAPRSLRGILGASVVVSLVAVSRLLRSTFAEPKVANETELDEVASIVAAAEPTNANLALLGDKRFVFSDDHKSFVMFGCEGKSWIAMGDPIGPDASADDAAWQFRESCDVAGVHPVFYQVDESSLGRYVEMGMSMLKLGEEARVPLADFSLEGSSRKDFRRTKKKCVETGLQFKIVPQREVATLMPQLKAISDAWLGDKLAGEKGFSLGFFNETYLSRFDIAVIMQEDEPIAFANIWRGANKQELSIDLMRYKPDAPHGVMEYLFIELMLYGHEEGFQWFSLGMAPLSGVPSHRLGPLWNRVSNLMFQHGEHFYNFQGLRNYKEKFDPVWTPKYLASPGGIATARILTDVPALISGGITKLLRR